jgi:hypothetical protein
MAVIATLELQINIKFKGYKKKERNTKQEKTKQKKNART